MFPRTLTVLFALLVAQTVFAEDAVLLRFHGRGLTAGDRFSVSSTMEYVVVDADRKPSANPDGGKPLDESMMEFRAKSTGKADWSLKVPKNGQVGGKEARFPFRQSIRPVPGRTTLLLVSLVISRSTVDPAGKPVSFTRQQSFPVPITDEANAEDYCVVFEGGAGGMLTVGVRPHCSDSVAPTTTTRTIPAPRH
jgi:hypothetical protein